jgi:hypothetical protein
MKLYVTNKTNQEKIYLDTVAPSRLALFQKLGTTNFNLGEETYSVTDVHAEPGTDSSLTGAVSGLLVGALAGPIGILFGLGAGLLIGSGVQSETNVEVNKFNESVFDPESLPENIE